MKHVGLFAFILLALWMIYATAMRLRAPEPAPPPPPKVLTPAEDLAAAKQLLSNPKSLNSTDIEIINKHLIAIAPTLPEFKEVPALARKLDIERKRVDKEAANRRMLEGVAGREKYVDDLERVYLKKGIDVHLSATGPSKTVFTFKYVLVSRPLVYQLTNSKDFMTSLSTQGFKKAIFTDGYNSTWTVDVN
jgi:hypothetical protein